MKILLNSGLSRHQLSQNQQRVEFSGKTVKLDTAIADFQQALHQVENIQLAPDDRIYGILPASQEAKRTQPVRFVLAPTCLKLDSSMHDLTPERYTLLADRLKGLAALRQLTPFDRVFKNIHWAKVTGNDTRLKGSYRHELSWWPRCAWKGGENAEFVLDRTGLTRLTLDGITQVLATKEANQLFRMLRQRVWQTPDRAVLRAIGLPTGKPTFPAILEKLTKQIQAGRCKYDFRFSCGFYTNRYDEGMQYDYRLKEVQFEVTAGKAREQVGLVILEPQKRYALKTSCGEFEIPPSEIPKANALLDAAIAKSRTQVQPAVAG